MPNPLFNAIAGSRQQSPGMDDMMRQLQSDPASMLRNAGYSVPENLMGNPQAMVMHLLRSGQVGGPSLQRIQPLLRMLTGR